MIKIATSLLALSLLAACQSTTATAQRQSAPRQNLQQRMLAQTAPTTEPAPPAEGPEDVPATRAVDPVRNPGLLPTPLLRDNAAGHL